MTDTLAHVNDDAIVRLGKLVLETVQKAGPLGAPSGPM
jgi:hypothetical protein